MLTKRETVLIIILMALLTVLGYYFLYLAPTLEKISAASHFLLEKENERDAAQLRILQYGQLNTKRETLIPEWERYNQALPAAFDDADMLNRIQDIIYDFTADITIAFLDNPIENDVTALHSVSLQFAVTYDELITILERFSNEDIYNRIINYSLSRADHAGPNEALLRVSMYVDYLTRR